MVLWLLVIATAESKCVEYTSGSHTRRYSDSSECDYVGYPKMFLADPIMDHISRTHGKKVRFVESTAPLSESRRLEWCEVDDSGPVIDEYTNVTVDTDGVVFNDETCETIEHGSCALALDGRRTPTDEPKHCPAYETVVSLTTVWGWAVFHVTMNMGPGLAVLGEPEPFLRDHPGVVFQLPSFFGERIKYNARRTYALEWLDVLGWGSIIHDNRIVLDPCVRARKFILPELGDCGDNPRPSHVHWLRDRVREFLLNWRGDDDDDVASVAPTGTRLGATRRRRRRRRRLLLVTRTASRVPPFWSKLRDYLSDQQLVTVDDFDDSTDLGTVPEQLARFARADIIVAPHGAGLLNIVAARPSACVLEFMPDDHFIPCFILLGRLYNLTYNVMQYSPSDESPNITFLDQSLRRCALHSSPSASV